MASKVRFGIIGTSWWTDLMYVPSLNSHPDATVVAVCGRDGKRAVAIAEKFGGAKVFGDYREMIVAGGLDAVIVASPDDLHYEMTMAVLDAGLHVLCEKPLSGNAGEARRMLEKAEAAGVKHMVLLTWRWQPHWRYLQHLVATGFIGRPRLARFEFLGSFALDPGYKWRFDGRRANGVTGDLGSHMIDFAQWFLGDIASVSADLPIFTDQSAAADPAPLPVNDAGLLTLRFASGARGQIQLSAVSLLGDRSVLVRVHLHGDEGTIEAEHIYFGVEGGVTMRAIRKGDPHFRLLAVPPEFLEDGARAGEIFDPYTRQSAGARHFVDAILQGKRPMPGFETGVAVQEVVDAALLSDRERRPVQLGPET